LCDAGRDVGAVRVEWLLRAAMAVGEKSPWVRLGCCVACLGRDVELTLAVSERGACNGLVVVLPARGI